MSSPAPHYRAPATVATASAPARRVTTQQVALIASAALVTLGAFALVAPRAPPAAPAAPSEAAPPATATLPLPLVRRADPPAPPPRAPSPLPTRGGMDDAQGCLRRGGPSAEVNACIVNALRDRASTEPELRLLCITYRQMGDRAHSVACMRRYRQRYPDTRHAAQFGEYILAD